MMQQYDLDTKNHSIAEIARAVNVTKPAIKLWKDKGVYFHGPKSRSKTIILAGDKSAINGRVALEIGLTAEFRKQQIDVELCHQMAIRQLYDNTPKRLNGRRGAALIKRAPSHCFDALQTLLVVSRQFKTTAILPCDMTVTAQDLALSVCKGGLVPNEYQVFDMRQILPAMTEKLNILKIEYKERGHLPAMKNAVSRQHTTAI